MIAAMLAGHIDELTFPRSFIYSSVSKCLANAKIKNHYRMSMKVAIVGLGEFGRHLAISFSQDGNEVLAVDRREKVIEEIKDKVAHAVYGGAVG